MQVDGNTITMINGDSEYILISFLDADGEVLPLENGDTVYFTMKKETKRRTTGIAENNNVIYRRKSSH